MDIYLLIIKTGWMVDSMDGWFDRSINDWLIRWMAGGLGDGWVYINGYMD